MHRQGSRRWEKSRSLISPALSITAVVIALSGVAYAADLLPVNSVGHKQIRNKAVGSAELRGKSVGTRHLKEDAVGAAQIDAKAVAPDSLAFPLGGSGVQTSARTAVVNTGHCGPWEGEGEPPPCPPPYPESLLSDEISLDHFGLVRIGGTVQLESEGVYGHTDGTASVMLDLKVDGENVSPQLTQTFRFGESDVLPFEALIQLPKGDHRVELVLDGFGYDYLDVFANSAVMTSIVVPR